MKYQYIFLLFTIWLLLTGCSSIGIKENNPFNSFKASDIERILICFPETIYGPEKAFYNPEEICDSIVRAESYLKPTGVAIKNKAIILELYKQAKCIDEDIDYPWSGILSYQVYLDKNGKVLGTTHIINTNCYVSFDECYIQNGWIHFPDERSFLFSGKSPKYCRIIYDFMKEHLPAKIKEFDKLYKQQGGLEKQLFEATTTP